MGSLNNEVRGSIKIVKLSLSGMGSLNNEVSGSIEIVKIVAYVMRSH